MLIRGGGEVKGTAAGWTWDSKKVVEPVVLQRKSLNPRLTKKDREDLDRVGGGGGGDKLYRKGRMRKKMSSVKEVAGKS